MRSKTWFEQGGRLGSETVQRAWVPSGVTVLVHA